MGYWFNKYPGKSIEEIEAKLRQTIEDDKDPGNIDMDMADDMWPGFRQSLSEENLKLFLIAKAEYEKSKNTDGGREQ